MPKAAWGRVYTYPGLMISTHSMKLTFIPAMMVIDDVISHCFGHKTHMYFTDQKTSLADISINEK